MPSGEPHVIGTYETVLYAAEPLEAARFYERVLGLVPVGEADGLSAQLRLPDGGVLLLFDPEQSSRPGRFVPSHGARGPGHVAFSVPPGELDAFARKLAAHGVAVEREVPWPQGGRSLYVRDPAGNSVELVDGDIWPPASEQKG